MRPVVTGGAGLLVLALLWASAGCGGPEKLAGANEPCFRAADCEPGLVCVPSAATGPSELRSSADLSTIALHEDAGSGDDAGATLDDTGAGGGPAYDGADATGGTA